MRLFREDNDCEVMKGELLKIKLIGKFGAALNSEPCWVMKCRKIKL